MKRSSQRSGCAQDVRSHLADGDGGHLFKRLLWLALVGAVVIVAFARTPLGDVHWDSPIYLYQAKRFAETPYVHDIAASSRQIVAQIAGNWPEDEGYSEAYWRASRLGHIAILGVLVDALGSTANAVLAAHWLFVIAMPLGLFAWCRVALLAGRLIDPDERLGLGLCFSALLFVLSDIYAYLSGNLVSEVISFGLGGAAVWALLAAVSTGAVMLAAVSGVLAVLGYMVRVESVWAWLAFMLAFLAFSPAQPARQTLLRCYVIAGAVALLGYALYAWFFHPLADPRHYLEFAGSLVNRARSGVHPLNLVFVVGGMLWLGAALALALFVRSPLVRFGGLWLLLAGLPSWWLVAAGSEVQTRMLIGLVPPLVLLSALGWCWVFGGWRTPMRRGMLGATLVLLLIVRPPVYGWLVEQPGVWRIQRLGAAMFVPKYERIDYQPQAMAVISAHVFDTQAVPTVLLRGVTVQQEYLNLIRFFGPPYSSDARLALVGDPTNPGACEHKLDRPDEPVRFCTGFAGESALPAAVEAGRVFNLRRDQVAPLLGATERLRAGGFVLEHLGR